MIVQAPASPRLGKKVLERLRRDGRVRTVGRRQGRGAVGIVHLGIGAFHRAHQAVFTEDAMEAEGSEQWGICGVTQRSRAVVDQLAPQDGLYALLERSSDDVSVRVVSSVHEVISAREQAELLQARFADPGVDVVTLTVTEKGYRRDGDGRLDLADPVVSADLAGGPPGSVIGQLVSGMRARRAGHGAPLTVISCDNLAANGTVVRSLVSDFCAALPTVEGDPLQAWIEASVSFPCSVVDRIVPATTDEDRSELEQLLGVRDAGLVVAEPFRQWVIQDDFVGPFPAWHRVGAVLTPDVAPHQNAKLRLLNATHSLLAYTGALAGYATIAETVGDDRLADAAARLMAEDAAPTLRHTDGLDLEAYQRSVLHRFANPALHHQTTQVAMDGSQKLPVRILGTVRDRLRAGAEPYWAALAVAAWMVYLNRGPDVEDPLADQLREAADGPVARLVERMLAVRQVFDPELADSPVLRDLLQQHVRELHRATSG